MASFGILVLGSVKALLLLGWRQPAPRCCNASRRACEWSVWATALAGTLLIPVVTPVLPRLELPVLPPAETKSLIPTRAGLDTVAGAIPEQPTGHRVSNFDPTVSPTPSPHWPTLMLLGWAAGAGVVLVRLAVAVGRTSG